MTQVMSGLGITGHWIGIHDGDARAVALYERHYSARSNVPTKVRLRHGIVGPGQSMILITVDGSALFGWQYNTIERYDHQLGVNCFVYRNEGSILSSELILEAEELAWQRWPGKRLFTYVWDAKVKSANPGYCFKKAGWRHCGRNADGRLTILEKLPETE